MEEQEEKTGGTDDETDPFDTHSEYFDAKDDALVGFGLNEDWQ